MLEAALAGARAEAEPAAAADLFAALSAFVGLVGMDWREGARAEFISLAQAELGGEPGEMVLHALAQARRSVTLGRLLISWVLEAISTKALLLEGEIARLEQLVEIANG